jgi:hypothetical protein
MKAAKADTEASVAGNQAQEIHSGEEISSRERTKIFWL